MPFNWRTVGIAKMDTVKAVRDGWLWPPRGLRTFGSRAAGWWWWLERILGWTDRLTVASGEVREVGKWMQAPGGCVDQSKQLARGLVANEMIVQLAGGDLASTADDSN